MMTLFSFSACQPSHRAEVNRLNEASYAWHYRNLDSTRTFAKRALALSADFPDGYAEALNNLAFVDMAQMNYGQARSRLEQAANVTDNQVELLVSDVLFMRLCQRESRNKDFYDYRERALRRIRRIDEEKDNLDAHAHRRLVYARSEFNIVAATYFYYVGLDKPFREALANINPDELEQDTAQYLNYLYNLGAGDAIAVGSKAEINQQEFDYLMRCYLMAEGAVKYPYWAANAMQAMSEHLQRAQVRAQLVRDNQPAIKFLDADMMPDSLLAGNLAQRSLEMFISFGDVYQIAGAYRTLAQCYWEIGDYRSAAGCLEEALNRNHAIEAAPDLVASIREQLSLVYSAIDDKPGSDYNRNIYLDLQEQTRQDRQLEARAEQLDRSSEQLNLMIGAVVAMIVVVVGLLFLFDYLRRRKDRHSSVERLLQPLEEWERQSHADRQNRQDAFDEIVEATRLERIHLRDNKRRNLEQRAKMQLVNSIMPFIDRMMNEVNRLLQGRDSEQVRRERFEYIGELTDNINRYNQVLTQWIQMRQGELSLHIESFPLSGLFDVVRRGRMSFQLKGVSLNVADTDAVVKADRTLTLFMLNTIADNARKFTPAGGTVTVEARKNADSVEIVITDSGQGMTQEQVDHLFDRTYTGGHGFGLLNCKGIIEKYKKVSSLFNVCSIKVSSRLCEGTRISFTLPYGRRLSLASSRGSVARVVLPLLVVLSFGWASARQNVSTVTPMAHRTKDLVQAARYADSAYFSNVNGHYRQTLLYADTVRFYLNRHYRALYPKGKYLMTRSASERLPAELHWLHDSVETSYDVILDMRNETAVAALALHDWALYRSNNQVYTQLFRECSADNTLDVYVRTMQQAETNKTVAVVLLVVLLILIFPAYYLLYYRHRVYYRICVERIGAINRVLLSSETDARKLKDIRTMWTPRSQTTESPQLTQLNAVVAQIVKALEDSCKQEHRQQVSMDEATDERNRVLFENGRLHVSNAILDNCLSTLKHETMYYPSRIAQMVHQPEVDLKSLGELVDYYKNLYAMLSAQAMRQVAAIPFRPDADMAEFLMQLLKKANQGEKPLVTLAARNRDYVTMRVTLARLHADAAQAARLFTPLTMDVEFLLCRQIVREFGEITNARGCGIQAVHREQGGVDVLLTLANRKRLLENFEKSNHLFTFVAS